MVTSCSGISEVLAANVGVSGLFSVEALSDRDTGRLANRSTGRGIAVLLGREARGV